MHDDAGDQDGAADDFAVDTASEIRAQILEQMRMQGAVHLGGDDGEAPKPAAKPVAASPASPGPASPACSFGDDDPVGQNIVCPALAALQAQPLLAFVAILFGLGALFPVLKRLGTKKPKFHDMRQRGSSRRNKQGRRRAAPRASLEDEDEDEEGTYYS